jgi:hypothetical protein
VSLQRLSALSGRSISKLSVLSAFGSVSPGTFAKRQLVAWDQLPTDITEGEMLEMIERICTVKCDELQTEYWLECLRANTGDANISDLIFWPGEYFRDGNNSRRLLPSEVLATALRSGGRTSH